MKKIISTLLLATLLYSTYTQAQAFDKGTKLLSLGIGGAAFIYTGGSLGLAAGIQPTFQFKVEGEYSVHKYVGIGFSTGIGVGGFAGTVLNVPIVAIGNFHFYQLIADKSHKNIHADKLDIYAGLNVGSGIGIFPRAGLISALVVVGPQFGARYYFTPKFGVNGEFGFGKAFFSAGITFKMGGKGKASKTDVIRK